MRVFKIMFFCFFCSLSGAMFAQPDSNYFQQQVNFNINVKLNDVAHTIKGFETIQYKNNSPHQLKYIIFHLWPNAYKNNETDLAKQFLEHGDIDFYYAPEADRGFIDSLLFKIGADTLKWEFYKEEIKDKNGEVKKGKDGKALKKEYIDIAKVFLKTPLRPDSTISITTPFFVKIPSGLFSRLGHIGQSYQVTQWYPKPAVYDKSGWNPMPYLNQGEFYSEFGNFDVSITVPANYLVAATGELTGCPQEERMLELKAKETDLLFKESKVDKIGNLIGTDAFHASSTEWKTLRYTQKNVHDFAWFADKRWHVLKGEYEFEKSGKLVTMWSFFTKENSRYWKKSVQYLNDALHYYSKWNGEYPYSILQAVDGTISAGGGMEYPTITNIGNVNGDIELETVIMHEVGHNWFYGILGSNEREHPWQDEGMNSANELRYMQKKYPELKLTDAIGFGFISQFAGMDSLKQKMQYYLAYKLAASGNDDQIIEGKAKDFTSANYGFIVYMKTAAAFNFLRAYLGDELYDQCMRSYYHAWRFKHPTPQDLRRVFERTSKKDLSWFFDDMLNSNKVIDYKVNKKKKPDTRSTVTYGWMKYEEGVEIKNKGGIQAPFYVVGYRADTIADKRWYPGFKGRFVVSFPNGNFDKIVIDPFYDSPESSHQNNNFKYKIKGRKLFARTEKIKLKFLAGYEDPKRSTLFYTPVIGGNAYDGWQAGMAFYNSFLFQKPFEWAVMPLYGIKSNKLNGSASITFNSNNRKSALIKKTVFGANGVMYSLPSVNGNPIDIIGRFYRVTPYWTVHFKPKKFASKIRQSATIRYNLVTESSETTCDGNCDDVVESKTVITNSYVDLDYTLSNSTVFTPHSFNFKSRYGGDFAYATVDFIISKILGPRKKKITARAYFGSFLFNDSNSPRFNLRGDGIRGYYDYTYETTFIGRFESQGLGAQQFAEGFANMKAPTAYGQSNKWNAALNLYSDLPIPFFKVFADIVVAPLGTEIKTVFDTGIYATLFGNALTIYVPFLVSGAIADEYEVNNRSFHERIRFTLNLLPYKPNVITKTIKLF